MRDDACRRRAFAFNAGRGGCSRGRGRRGSALRTAGRGTLSIWRQRSLARAGDSARIRAAFSSCVLVTLCLRRIIRRVESRIVTSSDVSVSIRRSSFSVATKVLSGIPRLAARDCRQPRSDQE